MTETWTRVERDFAEIAMAETMDFDLTLDDIREYVDYLDENFMAAALAEYSKDPDEVEVH